MYNCLIMIILGEKMRQNNPIHSTVSRGKCFLCFCFGAWENTFLLVWMLCIGKQATWSLRGLWKPSSPEGALVAFIRPLPIRC